MEKKWGELEKKMEKKNWKTKWKKMEVIFTH